MMAIDDNLLIQAVKDISSVKTMIEEDKEQRKERQYILDSRLGDIEHRHELLHDKVDEHITGYRILKRTFTGVSGILGALVLFNWTKVIENWHLIFGQAGN